MPKLGCLLKGDRRVNMGVGDSAELELALDSSVCNACAGRIIQN